MHAITHAPKDQINAWFFFFCMSLRVGLEVLHAASKLLAEPLRAVPLATWAAYCYAVFFSDALPGPDATQLDPATWTEVVGLSLNFAFVAPLLHLPFSPVLHPVRTKRTKNIKMRSNQLVNKENASTHRG
jgi:hypothetical protein